MIIGVLSEESTLAMDDVLGVGVDGCCVCGVCRGSETKAKEDFRQFPRAQQEWLS